MKRPQYVYGGFFVFIDWVVLIFKTLAEQRMYYKNTFKSSGLLCDIYRQLVIMMSEVKI
jgi:hypothetical protein